MERLWLTDCAYLLTKSDHWFCPQRCAVLDGETRQGLPAEERAGWSAYVSRNGSAKSSPTAAGRKNSDKWPMHGKTKIYSRFLMKILVYLKSGRRNFSLAIVLGLKMQDKWEISSWRLNR